MCFSEAVSLVDVVVNQRRGVRVGSFDDTGASYGVGVQYGSDETSMFMVEYMSYFQDDEEFDTLLGDFTLSGINFGYTGYF